MTSHEEDRPNHTASTKPEDGSLAIRASRRIPLRRKLLYTAFLVLVAVILAEFAVRPFVPLDLVGPSAVRFDPYYGKHLKSNYSGPLTARGNTYHLTTNSLGFRGPEYVPSDFGSVVCFGDSFGMGSTVDDGEEFAAIVQDALSTHFSESDIPVVNTSVAGNGQGRWLKFLRRDSEQYNPRYVVMQLCNNDFCDNLAERLFKEDEAGELYERNVPDQSVYRDMQEFVEGLPILPYSRLYAVFKQGVKHSLTNEPGRRAELERNCPSYEESEITEFDDLTFRLIEECLIVCRERQWPVVAVTANIPEGSRADYLRKQFAEYGATMIRIPTIHEAPEMFNTGGDTHWNRDGHEFVAGVIIDHLLDDSRFTSQLDPR